MDKIFAAILALIFALFQVKQSVVSKTTSVSPSPTATIVMAKSQYYFPLSDYFNRIKIRKFSQYFGPNDPKPAMECGRVFVGFHDGDDLEVASSEKNSDVPVKAVVSGKIVQAGHVNGYGGLLIESGELAGEPVTIYYGHVDLGSISKKVGDTVEAGEEIANLGEGCSSETDGERKHLHFAIKKGKDVDVRGYVPSEQVLSNWQNPGELLKRLTASE